ncbi:MAG: Rv3235 family protein [Actinomycetes bacterium]
MNAEQLEVIDEAPRIVRFSRPGSLEATADPQMAPTLQLMAADQLKTGSTKRKLFLVPTPQHLEGEDVDREYLPKPSGLAELPPLQETVSRYVLGVVEVWGGRRQPMQLARLSHRLVYAKILTLAGNQREIPKIRRVYINEPIEGVAETTVTLRFNDRVRSLVLRFEGVDKRWLCTELALL